MDCRNWNQMKRRDFLGGAIPACFGCLGLCAPTTLLSTLGGGPSSLQEKHMFDQEMPTLTIRQYFNRVLSSGGNVLNAVGAEIGEEPLLEILRGYSYDRGRKNGESMARQIPGRDFISYKESFQSLGEGMITFTVVEDSESVFEIAVTECVMTEPLLENGLGTIGNAWLCHGDYGHAQGYNPRIELVRDQTLMLGHPCCNHRYLWTD